MMLPVRVFCICLGLSIILFSSAAFAQSTEEKNFLLMYFKEEELIVEAPTRARKSLAQTAENVSVVTADEIKLMNAHSVAEVLNAVTGVQVFLTGGPGSTATAQIQGSGSRHVAVFMDGVPLNNLSDNLAELGSLPVQNIEKIEVIKGPASSAWGSALGGVINIITKAGQGERAGGMLSASWGTSDTGDFRAEASGKQAGVGYYLTAGRLQTDGFRPHNDFLGNNAYAKLNYDITDDAFLIATMSYEDIARDVGEFIGEFSHPVFGDYYRNNEVKNVRSTVTLRSSLSEITDVQVTAWYLRQHYDFTNRQLATGTEISTDRYLDDGYGGSIKLTWKRQHHTIVLGGDYDSRTLESNTIADNKKGIEKQAAFINDTMSFGRLTVTPGLRYDKTDTNGDFTSPSLGMTYRIGEITLLRASAARGFSVPQLAGTYGNNLAHISNPDLKMETVKSYQIGAETTAVKYVWIKVSGFRHDLDDVIENVRIPPTFSSFITVNSGRERRQGLEVELRTAPVYHASFNAGASFINAKDRDTGETISSVAQRTYDIGVQYDDGSFKALAKGHYIYWNTDPFFKGKYDDFIIDVHVMKTLYTRNYYSLEVFADVRNLFDKEQYSAVFYKNPGRWFEGGVRYIF
jgi:vitamin B12 transporter